MKDFLLHLFVPRESNNHRAKILHHVNIFLTVVFLLLSTFLIQKIKINYPSVLGISADISSEQLLLLTNEERKKVGSGSLVINEKLSLAASQKADDMFRYDYWAHNSPNGKTPWTFIKSAGYNYVYAGENLARGFSTPESIIRAWMASPDHKANMLSSNYRDVGFAVKSGRLNGEETILIVEEFGSLVMPITEGIRVQKVSAAKSTDIPREAISQENVQAVRRQPLINVSSLASNAYFAFVLIFIFVLFLDMIIVKRNKVMRFVGHNVDHILYLILVLALVGILSGGIII